MNLKELLKYADYDCPSIEFYNEHGELEYICNLWDYDFDDIDIFYGKYYEPYGVIRIKRKYEQTGLNGKSVQPPESEL